MFTLYSVPRRKLRLFKKLQVFLRGLRCVTNSQGNKGPTTCFYTLHNISECELVLSQKNHILQNYKRILLKVQSVISTNSED